MSFHRCFRAATPFPEPFWAGWTDEEEEGVFRGTASWRHLSNGTFQPWKTGEPNGDDIENCVEGSWGKRHIGFNDISCEDGKWFFCDMDEVAHYKLRGEKDGSN